MSLEEKYQIPTELGQIIHELVESILVNRPDDIIQWCYNHFNNQLPKIQEQPSTYTESESLENQVQQGTFYCYFTLKSLPHINHHYYILAFLSNDPFHVTKTLPILYEESCDNIYFTELSKFFLKVDDSILEQCLVLQVYDLERSKECISELNMDLFHLVRNSTLQWRDEQIVSLVVNEKEEGEDYEPSSQPLEVGVKYNWVAESQEEEFSKLPLPVIEVIKREEEIKPVVKGHIVIDWEWLEIIVDQEMDVYFVAFASNSPDKFIKTGLVKATGKGKFSMNERMSLWAEEPFEEETVIVLQVFKSLGVKELIAEKSIQVQKVINTKEWIKQTVEIEEQDEETINIGQAMVGIVWVKEEEKE